MMASSVEMLPAAEAAGSGTNSANQNVLVLRREARRALREVELRRREAAHRADVVGDGRLPGGRVDGLEGEGVELRVLGLGALGVVERFERILLALGAGGLDEVRVHRVALVRL